MIFDGPDARHFVQSYGYPGKILRAGECPATLFLELELLVKLQSPYVQRHAFALATEILALAGGKEEFTGAASLLTLCLESLRSHFADPGFSINSLAGELRVHRVTLARLFRKNLHITPGGLLRKMRLQRALELLRTTQIPVKETAFMAGFNDPAYFCRFIKRETGLTPAEHRFAHGIPEEKQALQSVPK